MGNSHSRDRTKRFPLIRIALLLVATGILGASSVLLTPAGSTVAAWWPASGTAAIALLLAGRRFWLVVPFLILVGMIANLAGGRPLDLSLVFGTVNAVESIVVVLVIARLLPSRRLRSLGDVLKFFIAAGAGSLALGVLVAITAALLHGADPFRTFLDVTPSHASALLVIVPMALVGGVRLPSLKEFLPQFALLVVVVLVVFWPGHYLPLAFLPLPVLTWAAIRFGFRVVAFELIVTASASLTLTIAGGGPFAYAGAVEGAFTTTLLQIFLLSYSTSVLLLAAVAAERETALNAARTSEEMLRAGLAAAQIGLLIVDRASGSTQVIEANPAASRLLDEVHGDHDVIADAHLASALEALWDSSAATWSDEWDAADGSRLQGFAAVTSNHRMSVQVIDITARHRTELATAAALDNELAAAEALRALNQRQDEFVSAVSHELRTPISSVIGFAEELEHTDLDETQQMYTSVIVRNGQRLLALVNDLLTLAALDRGELPAASDPRSLSSLVTEGVEDLQAQAKAGGVTLQFARGHSDLSETVHAQEVGQILTNLLSNAVKFTPSGGHATVALDTEDGMAILTVTDTGRGIPPAELDAVFEKFVRSSNTGVTPGTGLGLPIVKKIVDNIGGRITLESDGHSGTTVRVSIPTDLGGRQHSAAFATTHA
ncbi:MAG: MASE1 domain-containing protein [Salinibacterium sp.]|nr:MASE1 domain-containing protein [Salinibacterium sp.]